jgi:hypothetical protein
MNSDDKKQDKERDKAIYCYLFNGFAVVRNKDGKVNYSQTTKLFGREGADFAQRIYKDICTTEDPNRPTCRNGAAKLTTGKLVELLAGLQKGLQDSLANSKKPNIEDEQIPKFLKIEDILTVFQKLTELSSEEKEQLGLSHFTEELLLQQVLLNIGIYRDRISQETVLKLYKASIGLNFETTTITDIPSNQEDLIRQTTKDILSYIPERWSYKQEKLTYLIEKVETAIQKIKFQAGIKKDDDPSAQDFTQKYLTPNFLKIITRSVIENQTLNEEFPVYIRSFKIEQLQPLPLRFRDGLLNPDIFLPEEKTNNPGLESQYAYQVTVYFYLKKSPEKTQDFYVTSSGVGGQLSQIIKVINKTLLWDVECLRDRYFPIAHDLIINQEVIQNNMTSPVWSHSLVKLCTLEGIQKALIQNIKYEQVSYLDVVTRGDFCIFDFLESLGKSALQARLRAIKNTGVNPSRYLENLSERIQRVDSLRKAKSFLNFYPFSLNAMESHLKESLFKDGQKNDTSSSEELPSLCHYDGYLSIIDGYLIEGLYRNAYKLLEQLSHLKEISGRGIQWDKKQKEFNLEENNQLKFFSSALLVRYELSRANYFYLLDTEDRDDNYIPREELPNYERSTYVQFAWQALKNAETHLHIRIKKYHAINEISQSLFHPYFFLLANINFLRAKLYLFFPQDAVTNIKDDNSPLSDGRYGFHYGRIYFLEKARLDTARNGETELYTCYTAYQSWAYIMAGYRINESVNLGKNNKRISIDFKKDNCLDYAKKLIEHSLRAYAEIGRKAYYQIKEKSGVLGYRTYGNRKIENIPPIRETEQNYCSEQENSEKCLQGCHQNILYINMSLLWIQELNGRELEYNEKIYLFGTKACTILFALGIYELCSNLGQSIYPISETNDWKVKILRAYRLFSYAWAIAEDGGKTIIEDGEQKKYRIERLDFREKNARNPDEYHSPEVDSVRDLYPHRITEIADLGRVYAIGCNLILMNLSKQENEQKERKKDIQDIMKKFHDISRMSSELTEKQSRFNGHLATYLKRVENIVNRELNEFDRCKTEEISEDKIEQLRERIVKDLFASFYSEPVPN